MGLSPEGQHGEMHLQRLLTNHRALAFVVLLVALTGATGQPDAAEATESAPSGDPSSASWTWPVEGAREVTEPFRAPSHEYGPGHRGIDIAAPVGSRVNAPTDGVVAFRGVVVDRPLLTIDHGEGVVTTFEPMSSTLTPGSVVSAGDQIGTVATGGHSPAGDLHLGVRWNDVYINPLLMFGEVPRAILLPCCE